MAFNCRFFLNRFLLCFNLFVHFLCNSRPCTGCSALHEEAVNVKPFITYRFFNTLFTSLIFIWNLEIFLCKVLKAITPFTLASSHFLPTVMIESAVLVGNFLFTMTSLFSTFIRIASSFFHLMLVVHNLCLYWLLVNMPLLIAPSGVSQGEKHSASTMKWEIKWSWGSGCIVVQTMMI